VASSVVSAATDTIFYAFIQSAYFSAATPVRQVPKSKPLGTVEAEIFTGQNWT